MAISNENFNVLDATVLLRDFHRKQSWERWLTTKDNGCSDIKIEIFGISAGNCEIKNSTGVYRKPGENALIRLVERQQAVRAKRQVILKMD